MNQRKEFPSLRRTLGAVVALIALLTGCAVAAPAVGSRVGEFVFRDVSGTRYTSASLQAGKATVFLFLSTECPVSQRYAPRLVSLATEYSPKGVRFYGVHPNAQETVATVSRDAKERSFPFPVVKDSRTLTDLLGARMTPEAVVVDRDGVIRYRGRIDDNKDVTKVQSRDLQQALDALLAGRPVPRAEAPAFGCSIRHAPRTARKATGTTFTRDVAPILQRHCQGCHRPGEVAPFSLLTYEQAAAWAADLKRVTAARTMPPWKAAPGHGDFVNERRLTETEIATLVRWADGGTPKGEAKHMPPPARFPQGWRLGTPDLVLEPEESYPLEAEGKDVYRHFVLPKVFEEETWVTALEVAAQNRSVVHHVIAYIDPAGNSLPLDAADPGPGYSNSGGGPGFFPVMWLGGWAPGNTPRFSPTGTAARIPKGARIVLQVHYHKNGKPETDRTRIGLHVAKTGVEKRLRVAPVLNMGFEIPPGAERHEVKASMTLPTDVHLHSVIPHMHLLGRDIKLTATLPDGTTKPLVWLPDWDFNWQETYAYREPLALPKGTRIQLTAYYDNSEKNPHNPHNPPKAVRWGDNTTDEMCIAFLGYTVDDENLTASAKAGAAPGDDGIEIR